MSDNRKNFKNKKWDQERLGKASEVRPIELPLKRKRKRKRETRLDQLSPASILNMDDVIELTTFSRASIYRYMATGAFPSNKMLSPGRRGWRNDVFCAWSEKFR